MATKKRGVVLKSADEIAADKRARAAANDSHETVGAGLPGSPPPAPDPIVDLPLRPLARLRLESAPMTVGDFALNHLIAQQYARLVKEAGMLRSDVTEAQAQLLVLRGMEMGLAPLRALTELYIAPHDRGGFEIVEEATLMRAQVAASGLGIIEPLPEHSDAQRATVRAIRHDQFGRRETRFTFTLDDATRDGLLLRSPQWQSGVNRPALLVARATARARRDWFSDVPGARYTAEELGGGDTPDVTPPVRDLAVASPPPTPSPASAPEPAGAGQATTGNGAEASDAGGAPPPPVAPPPPQAAAPPPPAATPTPPPAGPPDALPPNATKEQKLAHYASVSASFNRPWTTNAGMSRDPQPVPIITHGALAAQLTKILDYVIESRFHFAHAAEAAELVVDHLGKLGIDTALMPLPYCLFALTQDEAQIVCEGLEGFAEQTILAPPAAETVVESPPNPLREVQPGQAHSWQQASEKFEAVVGALAGTATRGELLGLLTDASGKTFYELAPDELWKAAADLEQLSLNPTIFSQAVARMKMSRGS